MTGCRAKEGLRRGRWRDGGINRQEKEAMSLLRTDQMKEMEKDDNKTEWAEGEERDTGEQEADSE